MTIRIRITPVNIALVAVFIVLPILLWILLWVNEELFVRLFSGAPGLLAIVGWAFVGNFTIVLPAPTFGITMPLVIKLAEQNGVILVSGLYAGGAALGETSGYLAGRRGADIPFLGKSGWHRTLEQKLRGSTPDVVLAILSFIPLVLPFDVGGMIAGSIKLPYWRFLAATFLGRWGKYVLFILVWHRIINLSGYFGWIAFGCFLLIAGIVVWRYQRAMVSKVRLWWNRIRIDGIHVRFESRWGW